MNGRPVAGNFVLAEDYSDQRPLKAGSVLNRCATGLLPVILSTPAEGQVRCRLS